MEKRNSSLVLIMIITLIVLITMLIGILCSYFINVTKHDDNDIDVKVTNVMIFYSNNNQIKISDFKNIKEKSISVDVINYGDVSVNYEMSLDIIDALVAEKAKGVTYNLESISDGTDELLTVETTQIPSESKLIGSTKISPNTTHKYILHVNVVDSKIFKNEILTCGLTIKKGIN